MKYVVEIAWTDRRKFEYVVEAKNEDAARAVLFLQVSTSWWDDVTSRPLASWHRRASKRAISKAS